MTKSVYILRSHLTNRYLSGHRPLDFLKKATTVHLWKEILLTGNRKHTRLPHVKGKQKTHKPVWTVSPSWFIQQPLKRSHRIDMPVILQHFHTSVYNGQMGLGTCNWLATKLYMHVRSPQVYKAFSSRLLLTDHFDGGGCCFVVTVIFE